MGETARDRAAAWSLKAWSSLAVGQGGFPAKGSSATVNDHGLSIAACSFHHWGTGRGEQLLLFTPQQATVWRLWQQNRHGYVPSAVMCKRTLPMPYRAIMSSVWAASCTGTGSAGGSWLSFRLLCGMVILTWALQSASQHHQYLPASWQALLLCHSHYPFCCCQMSRSPRRQSRSLWRVVSCLRLGHPMSGIQWWSAVAVENLILNALCDTELDRKALIQQLWPAMGDRMEMLSQGLIDTTVCQWGEEGYCQPGQ